MNERFTPEALTKVVTERKWLFVNTRNFTLVPPIVIEFASKAGAPIILPTPALEGGDRSARNSALIEWFKKQEKASPTVVIASAEVVELIADPTFAVILNVTPFSPVSKEGVTQYELTGGVDPEEESVPDGSRATGFIHPQSGALAESLFSRASRAPGKGPAPA